MVNNISGVILAGGASRRFNRITKANLVIGGKKIISRITDTIKDIFDEIIIVTNTPEEFAEFNNYKIVTDWYKKIGPLGGIHSALKTSSKQALFVFAGDMPLLDKKFIYRQIDFYHSHKCDILVPQINALDEPLHAIYSKSLLKTLEEYLSGYNDYSVKGFFKRINVRYMQLQDTEENNNMFTNINSPAEIARIEKILRFG